MPFSREVNVSDFEREFRFNAQGKVYLPTPAAHAAFEHAFTLLTAVACELHQDLFEHHLDCHSDPEYAASDEARQISADLSATRTAFDSNYRACLGKCVAHRIPARDITARAEYIHTGRQRADWHLVKGS